MANRVTRWKDAVEGVITDLLDSQILFEDVTWELILDFRPVAPNQPPVPVAHIVFMVPSLLLGNPQLMLEAAMPVSGSKLDVPVLTDYLRGMLDHLVTARSEQLKTASQAPPSTNGKGLITPP
jgi:hypothetical protein